MTNVNNTNVIINHEYKYLLGATRNNELVFGKFEIRDWNGYPQFSASFNTVLPFSVDSIDMETLAYNWLDGLDKEFLYDLCCQYNCAPNDLSDEMADWNEYHDFMDCSLYPKEIMVDGETWAFESIGCGQCDTRNEMERYVNQPAYELLHELWDEYHLKKLNESGMKKVINLISMLNDTDNEKCWIQEYILEYTI